MLSFMWDSRSASLNSQWTECKSSIKLILKKLISFCFLQYYSVERLTNQRNCVLTWPVWRGTFPSCRLLCRSLPLCTLHSYEFPISLHLFVGLLCVSSCDRFHWTVVFVLCISYPQLFQSVSHSVSSSCKLVLYDLTGSYTYRQHFLLTRMSFSTPSFKYSK